MLPTWHPTASREALTRRAELLGAIRAYFRTSPALEVDTPSLSSHATVDPAIHSLTTVVQGHPSSVFLQTSTEFPMKRLLAAGVAVRAVIDIDANKVGRRIGGGTGVPVVAHESVDRAAVGDALVLLAVGSRGARGQIEGFLRDRGFVAGEDFLPLQ